MVALLGGNVTPYVLQTGSAHRERTVSRLPAEVLAGRKLLMHPPAGVGLQYPQQVPASLSHAELGQGSRVTLDGLIAAPGHPH